MSLCAEKNLYTNTSLPQEWSCQAQGPGGPMTILSSPLLTRLFPAQLWSRIDPPVPGDSPPAHCVPWLAAEMEAEGLRTRRPLPVLLGPVPDGLHRPRVTSQS